MTFLARQLRARQTPTELALWKHVRNRQMLGLKFRRQQPVYGFVADFYCEALRVAIEVDGTIHDHEDVAARDAAREAMIAATGVQVLRVRAEEVDGDLPGVIARLQGQLLERAGNLTPGPSPEGRRGEPEIGM